MALSETVKIEPKTDMINDPSGEAGDLSFDRSAEEMSQGDTGTGKKRKVFPYHITSELRALYKSGMIGVGIQYSSLIDAACERTGLSRAQVKSWIKRTKYHQKRVLRQEEGKDVDSYPMQSEAIPNALYLETSVEDHAHISLYRRENKEPVVEGSRLVIVEDDLPTRKDVIPALERHILATDLKGTVEQLKTLTNNSRQKQITMVTEDLSRVSRNEAVLTAGPRERQPTITNEVYSTTPIPPHAIQVTQHIPLQTAILQPVTLASHLHPTPHLSPPALVMTNGTTNKAHPPPPPPPPPVKESPALEATRLFKKIERNFKRLDELGYQGFAFSIHGEDTQLVYSGPIGHCFTPPLISYLRAVIISANPPPLLSHNHITTVNQTHISTPSSRQLYMYDPNPSRVQQRTAIYELSEADSVDENGDREENEYETLHVDGLLGANGKAVHVVVTQDPNYLDDGGMSE